MQSDKDQLRSLMKHRLQQMSQEAIDQQSQVIVDILKGEISVCTDRVVFLPLSREVQLRLLYQYLRSGHANLYVPQLGDDGFYLANYRSDSSLIYQHGMYQIQDPHLYGGTIDVILVPGLAFDTHGARLGRGGGRYDRFLCTYPSMHKIGVCFQQQIYSHIPLEAHDMIMDRVVYA